MVAIIEIGSTQLIVKEGDTIFVDRLKAEEGEQLVFDKVLVLDSQVGKPYLKGVTVEGIVQKQAKQRKIVVYRHNPKSTHKRKLGHRQPYTRVLISKINVS